MSRIKLTGKDVKSKRAKLREQMKGFSSEKIDVKCELIKSLIPAGLVLVNAILQEEVEQLAGKKYKRGGNPDYDRWGYQGGSVYLSDQKVPIDCPRVRDTRNNKEVELSSYRNFQEPHRVDEVLLRKVLHGLSSRRYFECSELIPETFGMSPSTISRRFLEASEEKLREFCERRLDSFDILCILLDGKCFQEDAMIIAEGITANGEKKILGFVQTSTENSVVCKEFLEGLLERGLKINEGILCVIDGSKGLRKGIEKAFGGFALIQRCQWHKRENVLSYLPKGKQSSMRKKLQRAYEEPTFEDAKRELLKVKEELSLINQSAVKSLDEGFEETLTLHKLGVFNELGTSLKTTNCIESVMAQIGQKTDRVDYWKNSNQKQRWLATALLDIEPRLRKIKGYRHLPLLRIALKIYLGLTTEEKRVA
ncbi:transposase [bacterium]|nr:transposase [bacterium]